MPELAKATDENFQSEVIDNDRPVLVDFWADWCHPCHLIEPAVKAVADELAGSLKVVKFNIDENPQVAGQYGVMSIPTLMLFVDGVEKARIIGVRPKDYILSEVRSYL